MILTCLASGSSGNCYLLDSGTATLILDAGIQIKQIKKGLKWDISKVAGAVATHGHLDHSRSVKDLEDMGIPVFKPYDETIACPLRIKYGSFDIQAFKLPHNGTPNYGFLITVENQKILYMTDFEYCKYVFQKQKVNHILIEANYISRLVDRDIPNYEHKLRGHCSLQTCMDLLNVNKSDALKTVILCHLSEENANAEEMVSEVQSVVGSGVFIDYARAGRQWELNGDECPF